MRPAIVLLRGTENPWELGSNPQGDGAASLLGNSITLTVHNPTVTTNQEVLLTLIECESLKNQSSNVRALRLFYLRKVQLYFIVLFRKVKHNLIYMVLSGK